MLYTCNLHYTSTICQLKKLKIKLNNYDWYVKGSNDNVNSM